MKNRCLKVIILYLIALFSIEIYALDNINNLPSRNVYFTGRDSQLISIEKKLLQYGKIYITGGGGIGKTQLAKEYSYLHINEYNLIWWFNAKNDLLTQYESLLTHISKSNIFNLLPRNIKNIAPNTLIPVVNSLLEKNNHKWLLIFDNLPNSKEIEFPKTLKSRHHIIVTTKEKQIFGKEVLSLDLFTNQESENFLLKILPKEKKEDRDKLSKVLGNYPLGLAQVSEGIIINKQNIRTYLDKHSKLKTKEDQMPIDTLQEQSNYQEVLNYAFIEIEKENKEAAKAFYMLILLGIDFKKGVLIDIFGSKLENYIKDLEKHGLIQTTIEKNRLHISIHDSIKESALKKLRKNVAYKKIIIQALGEILKNFYSQKSLQYLYKQGELNTHIAILNSYLNFALQDNLISEEVIDAAITVFKSNSMLLNPYSNYGMYEQLVNKIYDKKLETNVPPLKKALLYSNLIISSYVLESHEKLFSTEKKILDLIKSVDPTNNQGEIFTIYSYMSLFYIFLGDFKESKKYIELAYKYIDYIDDTFSLLRFWFTNAWLCYELRDIDAGIKAINNFEKHNCSFLSPIGNLFMRDLKIKFYVLKGQKNKALQEVDKTIKDAKEYSNNTPSGIWGELEYTKVLIYFNFNNYAQTKTQCEHALKVLAKAYGGEMVDLTQAHIHIILGKIYEDSANYKQCLREYLTVYKFYNKRTHGRINNFHEFGELLTALCLFYYKQNNYIESKHYLLELIENFSLEHTITEKLIKKLPPQFINHIGSLIPEEKNLISF